MPVTSYGPAEDQAKYFQVLIGSIFGEPAPRGLVYTAMTYIWFIPGP